ncbi:hypothetical protein BDQ94DRAFT_164696 [Aspergillus welwitschiae]|uniref:Uncharacterized protein n=1 Tax=Aspergillus welwitschiae TaxID=1341132 RepID=A0A3F3PH72_9EURO|nr:hypothetical protein BDQ94DRAFT_164696 [Aspergillus welwitschiae]RDH26187.1 hypothetical protein BDQ94DRAFT_164696 [Aspergillus welwitschiae]
MLGFCSERTLRVAELINDYRSLLNHIMVHVTGMSLRDVNCSVHTVFIEGYTVAQRLLSASFDLDMTLNSCDFDYTAQLKHRIILDASARRHQAHKVYLSIAAAKRWLLNRSYVLRHSAAKDLDNRLQDVDVLFYEEIHNVSDRVVASNLRAADIRSGYCVDEDPPLNMIISWIQSHY